MARLKWRTERTLIDSKKIECLTYDELLDYCKGSLKRKEDKEFI
jgi:hypothetical protein